MLRTIDDLPGSVLAQEAEVLMQFAPLTADWIDALMVIEKVSYSHPWTKGNFTDSINTGYQCQVLLAQSEEGSQLMGYYIAMRSVDEAHLLNITVAPACRGQGWAALMLTHWSTWAQLQQLDWLWLEVRRSNVQAIRVYEAFGFRTVGERKNYYPLDAHAREDALVMTMQLNPQK